VIAVNGDRVSIGDTLPSALARAYGSADATGTTRADGGQ
jgi:hypothetical protein